MPVVFADFTSRYFCLSHFVLLFESDYYCPVKP